MLKTLFRLVLRLAIIASLAYAARRALRQWVDGPDPEPARTPWTPVAAPPAPSTAAPSATTPAVTTTSAATAPVAPADPVHPAPAEATAPQPVEATAPKPAEATGPEPAEVTEPQPAEPQPAEPQAPAAGAAWVEAGPDGSAPESHPVKVKLSSRLYRLPGSASYDRTKADRCYASAEAAEADGFTRAKR